MGKNHLTSEKIFSVTITSHLPSSNLEEMISNYVKKILFKKFIFK